MPTDSEVLEQALAQHRGGNLAAAEQLCQAILHADPQQFEATLLLGVIACQVGQPQLAVPILQRAVELRPNDAAPHGNLGTALRSLGRLDEAVTHYRRALELGPETALARRNLGNALLEQAAFGEAEPHLRRATELDPNNAVAHNGLGNSLKQQGRFEEAAAAYQRGVQLKPDYAEAFYNLALTLVELGQTQQAEAANGRALELNPQFAEAHAELGSLRLIAGDFEQGWPEYEWRWRTRKLSATIRNFHQPLWDGKTSETKTILLHAEQGFGDALQFVRYASLVKQRCATVNVSCYAPLASLLESCPGVDVICTSGDTQPAFDAHAPLLSLPRVFRTTLKTIPADVPYLRPKDDFVERWREELQTRSGFKIGIAWQGNPAHLRDRTRSFPVSQFASISRIPGVSLYSLQKGAGCEQLTADRPGLPVVDLADRLTDFQETAAAMLNLDLVITCDSAPAHLAGALGVPVWVALPFVPDWRWLLDREDSPWYPTMRLFRQRQRGDWPSVFREIEMALREHVSQRAGHV